MIFNAAGRVDLSDCRWHFHNLWENTMDLWISMSAPSINTSELVYVFHRERGDRYGRGPSGLLTRLIIFNDPRDDRFSSSNHALKSFRVRREEF